MTIYNDLNQIQNLSSTNYTVEELIQQFNDEDISSNRAQINQCVICAKIQQKILDNHKNNTNSKAYKKEATNALVATKLKKNIFNYNADIGRYVLQQNDPTIYELSKRQLKVKIDQEMGRTPRAPRRKTVKPDYPRIIEEKDQEIVSLKERIHYLEETLKQEQDNNDTLLEHFTDTINCWQSAFVALVDYFNERDIDWQQLLQKQNIKNPLTNFNTSM